MALAAGQHLGALAAGILDVALDLVDRGGLDQRPLLDARVEALADLEALHRLGEPRRELVVDLLLHVDAVGAHAGLAAVAELARDRALDRGVEVGVVEDDQRRVPAELHAHLLDGVGARLEEELPTSVEPVNDSLRTRSLPVSSPPTSGAAGDHIEYALGNAGALGQLGKRQRRIRGEARGLGHHGAARRERRRALPRDHGVREVPGRDRGTHPDRLLEHHDPARARRAGIMSPYTRFASSAYHSTNAAP